MKKTLILARLFLISVAIALISCGGGSGSSDGDIPPVTPPNNYAPIPDTGQTSCFDVAGNDISYSGYGMDGDYAINVMSFTDNGDGTITDNITALIWQKQDNGIAYNWHEASGIDNLTYNLNAATDVCGSLTLGGYTDWRLPNEMELMYMVDYELSNPSIDSTYFLNANPSLYVSATSASSTHAWCVDFNYGGISRVCYKSNDYYVRCVRGTENASNSFTDNGNGTVTDNNAGLLWQQVSATGVTWEAALAYCEGLSLAGHIDWRLPNIKEARSIGDISKGNPAIDTSYFPNGLNLWTSTTFSSSPSYAWCIGPIANTGNDLKTNTSYNAQCVR